MLRRFLQELRCPTCSSSMTLEGPVVDVNDIAVGQLRCESCSHIFPIINGIPRFVPLENYAAAFGIQWNMYPKTQLDSYNKTSISGDRFFQQTHWPHDLHGQRILEVGCGMGRFTEVVLPTQAICYAFDYSNAVDAAKKNMSSQPNYCLTQASVYEIPFPKEYFDKIFCFGVLQHTPNVSESFHNLLVYLKPGGQIAIDVYAAPWQWFLPKRILRPISKRMNPDRLYRIVERVVPFLLKISNSIASIPKIGNILRFSIPVANYNGRYPLSKEQLREWAILDTFDMLNPRYDQPQRAHTIRQWMTKAGLQNIQIERNVGIIVARGEKPPTRD